MSTLIAADLRFTLEREGRTTLSGHLTGRSNRLVLEVDDAGAFAGSRDAPAMRAVAEGLARRGMVVRVTQGDRHLVTLGAVRSPWWQRPFTRSSRIRLGSLRGAMTSAQSRTADTAAVLPDADLLPPPTLWPLVPTMHRRVRRSATTHDPSRGGAPRIVLIKDSFMPGDRRLVIWLHDGLTIGSAPDSDVRIPELAATHARFHHDDDDEWVIEALAAPSRVHGAPIHHQILRTGARITLGPHQFAYVREEYADHGRPFGGRIGGELGHQRSQPGRPGHLGPEF